MQDRHHISGVQEPLPEGETVLWEGQPAPRLVAREIFHVRALAVYFVVLVAATLVLGSSGGLGELVARLTWLSILGATIGGMVFGLSIWMARSTRYAVTSDRVVILKGMVFPSVISVPFRRIRNITVRHGVDESGGLALELVEGGRIGMLFLWPHARPWKLAEPQPMLRCLDPVSEPAEVLRDAYTAFLETQVPEPQMEPAEYRLLDDDDVAVVFNRPLAGAESAGEGESA